MKPSFATPTRIVMSPTRIANIDASAIALSGSPLDASNGTNVAAIIGPSEESGPSTSTRDGPNSA